MAAQARAHADALEAQAGAWAAGADGERRVAAALDGLPHGWHVHHDRLLRPGRTQTNLDHVVIGPSGVYLVDTKNWAGGTSVHDGNLWQHTSSSSPKGRELDTVARFAGEMERALGLPVVPVIALAGGRSTSFSMQRVRGVEIIPADELVDWLMTQPPAPETMGESAERLSRKVDHTYPAASADTPPAPDPDELTIADVFSAARSPARRPPSPVTAHGNSRAPRRQGGRRGPRRRGSVVSGLVGLVALWAFSQVGPHIFTGVLAPRAGDSVTTSVGAGPSAENAGACRSLSGSSIRTVTGARTAIEKPTASEDTCMWWLTKPRYSTDRADVTVEMGRAVQVRFGATGTTRARIDMSPGGVSAWVPQNTALPGWKAGLRTSQSLMISYRFSYPPGASEAKARAVEAAAEKKVTRLAEELAKAVAARRST